MLRWIVAVSLSLSPFPDPGMPRDLSDLPACRNCEGKGVARLDCEACEGSGTGPCSACANPVGRFQMRIVRLLLAHEDPEAAARIAELNAEIEAGLAKWIGRSQDVPGSLRCPANCLGGKSINQGRDCLLCKATGGLTCVDCKGKGRSRCWSCAGARRVELPCPECAASGRSPGISARETAALESCPWCQGEFARTCAGCPAEALELRSCETCAGRGDVPDPACAGTRNAQCRKCYSSGDLSSYLRGIASRSSNRCDVCKARGTLPCESCRRGRVTCPTCQGERVAAHPCRACRGKKRLPCAGCAEGVGRAWVVAADRLLEAGERELGRAHLEHAIRREEARIASEVEALGEEGRDRTRVRRALERERLAPLRLKLEQFRRP